MNEQLSPEDYALLLQLGSENSDIDAQIALQQAQAQRMREMGQAPQGGMAGRTYVNPHWTQYAAGLANQYGAGKKEQVVTDQQAQRNKNQDMQNQMIMRGILAGARKQSPTSADLPYPYDPESDTGVM